jgi:cobalt-zinc-cadmium efflux system outer membrane protein
VARRVVRVGATALCLALGARRGAAQQVGRPVAPKRPRPTGDLVAVPARAATRRERIDSLPPRSAATRHDSVGGLALVDLERLAADSNPGLRAARLDIARAAGDVTTAGLRPNPFASVIGDLFSPRTPMFGTTNGQAMLSVFQPVELGGKRARRVEVATAVQGVVVREVADSARRVLLAVRLAWVDVLAAREQLALAERALATWDRVVTLDRARLQEQQISGAELARVEVARSQADLAREQAVLDLLTAETTLAALVGRTARVPLADSLVTPAPLRDSLPSLEATALALRTDLRAARQARVAAEANVRLQDANARITPAIGGDVGVQPGNIPLFGVSASIPLAIFDRNQGEREKARATVEQVDRVVDGAALQVRADVRAAWAAYQVRLVNLRRFGADSAGGILGRARAVQESAEYAYRAGGSSLLEYLDAQRTFTDIQRAYVDAVAQYDRALAQIVGAVGALGMPRDGLLPLPPP